jgi:iron complex outermembrane receptor protein
MPFKNALFTCAAVAALTSFAGLGHAADATAASTAAASGAASSEVAGTVGEVVVTARKTSENLQRVPLAVTAITGAALTEQRIAEPTDLAKDTPSLFVRNSSSSANSAQIALRGQYAADSLLGINQPVGVYEDTVSIPHPFGANNAFFDLDRVEVLKGPQGTLYGRNTTAGAVNIITRNADYNGVHGFIEGELGDYKDARIGGAVNIPIIPDVFAARVSYQHWNRDGFGKSLITNQTFGDGLDSDLARLSLKWDPAANFTAVAKVEYGHNHNAGQDLWNAAITPGNPFAAWSTALWSDYAKYAPMLVKGLNGVAAPAGQLPYTTQVANAGAALLAPCLGVYVNCAGATQWDIVRTWHGSLDWTWKINDNISLRSITGYHAFVNDKDGDLSAIQPQVLTIGYGQNNSGQYLPLAPAVIPGGYQPLPPDYEDDQADAQVSQEFNLSGKAFENKLDWMVGFYYSSDVGHGAQPAGDLEELYPLYINSLTGVPLGDPTNPANSAPGTQLYYTQHPNLLSPPFFSHDAIKVGSNTWAVFTQDTIKFNDVFSLTLGGRWTQEHAFQSLSNWHENLGSGPDGLGNTLTPYFTCDNGDPRVQYSSIPDCSAIPAGSYVIPAAGMTPAQTVTWSGAAGPNGSWLSVNNGAFTYLTSLNVQFTPNTLGYFKVSRGFRGAAYGRANGPPAKPEFDQDYELGLKTDLFEHRLRINLAMFESDITNKQVSSLKCIGVQLPSGLCDSKAYTTVVLNAASERVRGVELEWIAVPIKGLTLNGNVSYNDSIYVNFPGASSGDGLLLCKAPCTLQQSNAAGEPVAVSPSWQGDVAGKYEFPIFGEWLMAFQGDINYRGSFPITGITHQAAFNNFPGLEKYINRGVTLINASIEFRLPDDGLTMTIFGTNLGNVAYGYQGISPNYTGGIAHEYMQAPREFGGTIRKTFGGGS